MVQAAHNVDLPQRVGAFLFLLAGYDFGGQLEPAGFVPAQEHRAEGAPAQLGQDVERLARVDLLLELDLPVREGRGEFCGGEWREGWKSVKN